MASRSSLIRRHKQGSALAAAMMFFVMITIAATALLSISAIHRIQIVRNGIDVRLMIAAEAGIETVRGRFTIVPIIQEDWNSLVGNSGWNHIETLTVNGITVTVEAHPVGGPSVPTARVRSRAVSGTKARTVEYMIKVATFSDFAVFNAGSDVGLLGLNYKLVGNSYFGGNVSIPNQGAQLWGSAYMVGSVVQGYGAGNNPTTGQPWNPPPASTAHFPVEPPAQNQPAIPLPTWASPWGVLEGVADSVGHLWAENTLAIELRGTTYRRYFVRRTSAAGGNPSGTDWLNLSSAVSLAPNDRLIPGAASITANGNYALAWQDYDIPDEGVIYVGTGTIGAVGASANDTLGGTNTWIQSTDWGSNTTGGTITNGVGTDHNIVRNNGMPGAPFAKVLLLWGVLEDRRVSIACEHKIILADTISYRSLRDNPEYRNFHGNGSDGKQSPGALGFKEMLGVMGQQDVMLTPTWWRRLPTAESAEDVAGELIPGHIPTNSFSMDGVYFSLFDTRPHRFRDNQQGEFWGHGGLIAGGSYAAGMGNHFTRRNYDWDFRMATTTPPYFLRAYNASAVFLAGTWRTYES